MRDICITWLAQACAGLHAYDEPRLRLTVMLLEMIKAGNRDIGECCWRESK